MDRISTSTKAVDLYGPGKHGFKNGNLSLGITPTDFNAEWCNGLQEELLAVIEGAGLAPDAGTLNQLQQAIQLMIAAATAQDFKASVRVATTANVANLAGGAPNALDGIALALNDRILVKDQATPAQNGIYVVTTLGTGANGAWARATDADGVGELTSGAIVAVEEGATHADTLWMLTTDGPITIGTTPLTFARKDSATARQIQPIGASVAANALTVTVQPTTLDFRDATLSSGTVNARTLAAAASLVVPSGATLGTANGVASRLVVLLLDNAGTLEPAIVNLAGGVSLDETGVISTTAISGAANSASVVYSQSSRANLPYRVVGFVDSTQATAGTWATAPSRVQGAGGLAVSSSQIQLGSAVVSASGVAVDFIGIPSWAKRITVIYRSLSTTGSSPIVVRLGSGGVTASGYAGAGADMGSGVVPSVSGETTGFRLQAANSAAVTLRGVLSLCRQAGNVWVATGTSSRDPGANNAGFSAGDVALAGPLDRIRITTVGGTDTFDDGTINISWE